MMAQIPCAIYRGGTSKGLLLDENLLPEPGLQRDHLLLALMGGPDAKQIDGLGGGVTTTSKVALVRPSERPGVDVDYTLAQVVVGQPHVDYRANCGNMSSAVGPFAIEQGWVKPVAGHTKVSIFNTNTQKLIVADIPTTDSEVIYDGEYRIAGVMNSGSKISLEFQEPQGAATGHLLPTGNAADVLSVPEIGEVRVSVVDAANLFIFLTADELKISGCETSAQLSEHPTLMDELELIRGMVAHKLGYVSDYHNARTESPAVPKIIIVAPPMEYMTSSGEKIPAQLADIHARMVSGQKPHPTIAMTGAMCLAAASVIPGTVVHQIAAPRKGNDGRYDLSIAHPGGVMEVGVICREFSEQTAGVKIDSTIGYRTARLLMNGYAFYPDNSVR